MHIEKKPITYMSSFELMVNFSQKTSSLQPAVRVRTDKANFGPPPISLIFSVNVDNPISCTNIMFILKNSIIFIFYELVFKVTSKLPNLTPGTSII